MGFIRKMLGMDGAPEQRKPGRRKGKKYGSSPRVIACNAEIMKLAQEGARRIEIASIIGCKIATVHQVLKNSGIRTGYMGNGGYASTDVRQQFEARNAEIVRKYEGGMVAEAIGQELGITRERVCQILRPLNVISTKQERDRLAKEAVALEQNNIKAEAKARIDGLKERAVAIVRDGGSHNDAAVATGLGTNIVSAACKAAGVMSGYGRWRDFEPRKNRIRELAAEGHHVTKIIRVMREEGDTHLHANWVIVHCSDIEFKKGTTGKNPEPVVPKSFPAPRRKGAYSPDPDAFFTPERTIELRRYYFNGVSGQQIADIMGCSRNTVLGKLHRLRKAGQLLPVPQQIPQLVG